MAAQIENKQYVVKIEDLNEELLKLKSTTGRTVKVVPAPHRSKRCLLLALHACT